MRILIHVLLVLTIFALGAGVGYHYALEWQPPLVRPPTSEALATVSVYIYGTAVDATGKPLAGVTVSAGTRFTTTKDRGEWGQTWDVTAGATFMLFVIPEPIAVKPPTGQRATLDGNVLTINIPQGVSGMLGPFALTIRIEPTATWTPIPTEPVITQTWTPTKTVIPSATPTLTPAPYPTSAITGFWDVPGEIADEIAAEARLHYGEPLETYQVAAALRLFRWGRALELGIQVTNQYTCYGCGEGAYNYMAFAGATIVEKDGIIGVISPHGRWRYWSGKEPL